MEDDQIAHDAPRVVVSADYSSVLLLEIEEKDYCYHRLRLYIISFPTPTCLPLLQAFAWMIQVGLEDVCRFWLMIRWIDTSSCAWCCVPAKTQSGSMYRENMYLCRLLGWKIENVEGHVAGPAKQTKNAELRTQQKITYNKNNNGCMYFSSCPS